MVITDIFQTWKENRFIIASKDITDGERIVVLTDIKFWVENLNELIEWCDNTPNAQSNGMTVTFNTDEALMLFVLRWS